MKLILTLIAVINISALFSQKKFLLLSHAGIRDVLINGKKYKIERTGISIKTLYPKFDTLSFLSGAANQNDKIICNFKPDSSYVISGACCGSLDIIPQSRFNCDSLKYWDGEKDFEKIQNLFLDKPYLSVRTRKPPADSLYAWHADAACVTAHSLIDTSLWKLGIPPKCFYWNNITPILFFKTDALSQQKRNDDVAEFLDKKNVIELTTIYLRLFDNQKFILTFDEETRSVKLSYDKP